MHSSIKLLLQLLVVIFVITICVARPQQHSSIDNQDSMENQQQLQQLKPITYSDVQKYYSSLRLPGPGGYLNAEEVSPLERFEMQYVKNQLGLNGNIVPGYNGNAQLWSPLIRLPEIKRQVRYRQCYFNPISCFKK